MHNFVEHRAELQKTAAQLYKELAGTMAGFAGLHKGSMADGALDRKHKELIAVAISVAVQCEGCIAYHVHDALQAGATRQEVVESLGVAIMMGGGPAVMYACEALAALDQFASATAV